MSDTDSPMEQASGDLDKTSETPTPGTSAGSSGRRRSKEKQNYQRTPRVKRLETAPADMLKNAAALASSGLSGDEHGAVDTHSPDPDPDPESTPEVVTPSHQDCWCEVRQKSKAARKCLSDAYSSDNVIDLTKDDRDLEANGNGGVCLSNVGSQQHRRESAPASPCRRQRRSSTEPELGKNETIQLLEAGLRLKKEAAKRKAGADPLKFCSWHSQHSESSHSGGEDAFPLDTEGSELPGVVAHGNGGKAVKIDSQPSVRGRQVGKFDSSSTGGSSMSMPGKLRTDSEVPLAIEAPPEDDGPSSQPLLPQLAFAVILGLFVGLMTLCFHLAAAKVEHYHIVGARILGRMTVGQSDAKAWIVRAGFSIYMVAGSALSALVVSWTSQRLVPECIGGGTIATKICLAMGSPVPLRVGAWRFVLSAVYVGSGNVLGIEAPTLHLCAAVASAVHRLACLLSERLAGRVTMGFASAQPMFTSEGLPQAVVLGCAAGLSAAFGSPLAAISYAVEEYVDVRQTGTVTALVLLASLSAALVCRAFEQYTGAYSLSIAVSATSEARSCTTGSVQPGGAGHHGIMPWLLTAALIGIVLGVLSPLLMTLVLKLRSMGRKLQSIRAEIVLGGLAGLFSGALGCTIYLLTGCDSAWGLGRLTSRLDPSCDAGSSPSRDEEALVTLALGVAKLLAFAVCFSAGGAGGVLMPSLVVGAMLGRCVGLLAAPMDANLPQAGAILGMAAFFSANMRLPLTAAGMALEYATVHSGTSYDVRLVYTIPLASGLATWVASWWDPFSIFERMMIQDGINPFTLSKQIQFMIHGPPIGSADCSLQLGSDCDFESSRRNSISSKLSDDRALGPLAPPARCAIDEGQFGQSHASSRIVMAARRRSLITDFRAIGVSSRDSRSSLCPVPSFISSPDEFIFASRAKTRQVRVSQIAKAIGNTKAAAVSSGWEDGYTGRAQVRASFRHENEAHSPNAKTASLAAPAQRHLEPPAPAPRLLGSFRVNG